jgi:hypothetical protein
MIDAEDFCRRPAFGEQACEFAGATAQIAYQTRCSGLDALEQFEPRAQAVVAESEILLRIPVGFVHGAIDGFGRGHLIGYGNCAQCLVLAAGRSEIDLAQIKAGGDPLSGVVAPVPAILQDAGARGSVDFCNFVAR